MNQTLRTLIAAIAVAATLSAAGCGADDPETPGGQPTGPAGATGDPGGDAPVAGDRLYFYPPVEGAELTITSDADGGDSTVTVVGVEDSDGDQTVRINQVFSDTEGLEVEAGYTADADGSLTLEIDMFLLAFTAAADVDGASVETSGDDMVIPAIEDLEAGETSSGTATIAMELGGFDVTNETSFTVSGAGYESVTAALGTFEAYVVDVDMSMVSSLGISAEGTIRYWFVPGFGWVRQETTIDGTTLVHEVSASTVDP